MRKRTDLSNYLIHFTKDTEHSSAYHNFMSIIEKKRIYGNSSKVKGGYKCVSFTEAPCTQNKTMLVNSSNHSLYSGFGFMTTKQHISQLQGAPVIYQSEDMFYELPENLRWKHVTFDLSRKPPIDFTWEREWRVKKTSLEIDPLNYILVVPNREIADNIVSDHYYSEMGQVKYYDMIIGDLAEFMVRPFQWNFEYLS
ncbi:MAG: hypothetical protein ABR572_13155 [Cryomorphaceae bacterium]